MRRAKLVSRGESFDRWLLERATPEPNTGCVLWLGATTSGYGRVHWKGRFGLAHRIVYEMRVGPIPEGLVIDHLCRERSCVNERHLQVVTTGENVLRGVGCTARNAIKTHCLKGHPFDEANTYWRLTGGRSCRRCSADWEQRKKRERYAAAVDSPREQLPLEART